MDRRAARQPEPATQRLAVRRLDAQMLHHVSLGSADLARSTKFYDAVLSALGYARVWTTRTEIGYGSRGSGDKLAIKLRDDAAVGLGSGFHLAFAASSRDAVEAFHRSALEHGGQDNGSPGPRPAYGPNYFAAFVIDPDGHRLEAVINEAI